MIVLTKKSIWFNLQFIKIGITHDKKIKENTGSEILGIIAHDAIDEISRKKYFKLIRQWKKIFQRVIEKTVNVYNSE